MIQTPGNTFRVTMYGQFISQLSNLLIKRELVSLKDQTIGFHLTTRCVHAVKVKKYRKSKFCVPNFICGLSDGTSI